MGSPMPQICRVRHIAHGRRWEDTSKGPQATSTKRDASRAKRIAVKEHPTKLFFCVERFKSNG